MIPSLEKRDLYVTSGEVNESLSSSGERSQDMKCLQHQNKKYISMFVI